MADIEAEREMNRSDVAEYLRTFADELDASGETHENGPASNDRTSGSDHRDADSTREDGTSSNGDAETGTGNADTTGNADATDDSDTTNADATDASGNDANESATNDTTDDGHATDVEQRNREESNRSSGSSDRVTFMVGNESTTINPPETVTFEVSVDSDSSLIGSGTGRTARFALHWDESDVSDDEDLSIQ